MIKKITAPAATLALVAVTATSAYAFSSDSLQKIGVDLTEAQVSAFEEAHELRESGADRAEVKTFLEESGIDENTIKEVGEATHEMRHDMPEAVRTALENNDYNAFLTAVADSPLADAINSEADFETFKAANELRKAGDHEGAQELMAKLGIEKPAGHDHKGGHRGEFSAPSSQE